MFNDGDVILHTLGRTSKWVRIRAKWFNLDHVTIDGDYLGSSYSDAWAEEVLAQWYGHLVVL